MTIGEERASPGASVTLPEADAAPMSQTSTPSPPEGRLSGTAGRIFLFKSRLLSLLRDRSVRVAAFSFSMSRLLILALIVLTPQVTIDPAMSRPGADATTLTLHRWPVARILRERVTIADSWWYQNIAKEGYDRRPFAIDKT